MYDISSSEKPGKVSEVDIDDDPGPESRLLPHVPPPSAHPHLKSFWVVFVVSISSIFPTTTFRSLLGRSLKILSRTSAGNVLLIHPAAILASHFWNSSYLDLWKAFSWGTKFWTCLYPWSDHLTAGCQCRTSLTPQWSGGRHLTTDLPDQSHGSSQNILNLTRWPSDSFTERLVKCWPFTIYMLNVWPLSQAMHELSHIAYWLKIGPTLWFIFALATVWGWTKYCPAQL